MNNNHKIKQVIGLEYLLIYFSIFYIASIFLSTTLVLFTAFNLIPFYVLFLFFISGFIFILFTKKIKFELLDIISLLTIIFFCILSYVFFHHDLYGVRDEGVYANSAIGIVDRGSIYIKDFINFPIWVKEGNAFIPPFLFGTNAWIALLYALFKLKGIYMTNVIPILIGGLSYYYIAKLYIKSKAIHLLFCFFLSYPMIWFSRRTVSEIIFFSLLWFSFYLIFKIYINGMSLLTPLLFFTCCTYILIRGEGMVYFLISFLFIIFINWRNKKDIVKYCSYALLFIVPFLYYSFFVTGGYLEILDKISGRTFSKLFPFLHFKPFVVDISSSQILHTPGSLYYNIFPFVLHVFSNYNMLFFIFSIIVCLIHFLISKHKKNKINVYMVFLIFINLPTFYSFFNMTIAPDQPWFLRRYLFSVIPLAYICGFILLNTYIKNLGIKNIIFTAIIVINILISTPIITFSDYKEIPQHIDNLAKFFSSSDVIVVDQYANGWYRLYDELYFRKNLNAYYIDVSITKNNDSFETIRGINFNKFKNIYFITKENSQLASVLNNSLFKPTANYTITYTSIIFTSEFFHLPNIPNNNSLNLNYHDLIPLITVPDKTYTESNKIVIYKVTSKEDFIRYYKLNS